MKFCHWKVLDKFIIFVWLVKTSFLLHFHGKYTCMYVLFPAGITPKWILECKTRPTLSIFFGNWWIKMWSYLTFFYSSGTLTNKCWLVWNWSCEKLRPNVRTVTCRSTHRSRDQLETNHHTFLGYSMNIIFVK